MGARGLQQRKPQPCRPDPLTRRSDWARPACCCSAARNSCRWPVALRLSGGARLCKPQRWNRCESEDHPAHRAQNPASERRPTIARGFNRGRHGKMKKSPGGAARAHHGRARLRRALTFPGGKQKSGNGQWVIQDCADLGFPSDRFSAGKWFPVWSGFDVPHAGSPHQSWSLRWPKSLNMALRWRCFQ